MLIRLGVLADRIAGRANGAKRQAIRWPKELLDYKEASRQYCVGVALDAGSFMPTLAGLALLYVAWAMSSLISLCLGLVVSSIGVLFWVSTSEDQASMKNIGRKKMEQREWVVQTMSPLLGKDPYLDLRSAAFLTVGAMPKWLWKQMLREPGSVEGPGWQKTRLAAEPYTVKRAGLDYLDLMSEIELRGKALCGEFRGEPFPPLDHRLPSPLKEAVGKIILLLSSLPDSGKEPEEDAVEAVMDAVDRLATIDGRSFVAAVRDSFMEAKDKEKADYNSEVMNAVDASMHAQASETGEGSKTVQENMETLRKMSETAVAPAPAVEASDPSQALAAKAKAGSKIARELMSQYSALEATALRNGESIEVLRSKFTQGFAAMDDLLTVSEDAKKNSDFYEDPKAISELVLRGEHGLRSKMVEEARLINSGNVLKAQASAAYLSSAN